MAIAPESSSSKTVRQGPPFLIQMAQPYYHPDPKYDHAFYLQMIVDTLFATGPALQQRGFFVIADMPVGQWIQLKDNTGRNLPAGVQRTASGQLLGSWLFSDAG